MILSKHSKFVEQFPRRIVVSLKIYTYSHLKLYNRFFSESALSEGTGVLCGMLTSNKTFSEINKIDPLKVMHMHDLTIKKVDYVIRNTYYPQQCIFNYLING